MRRGSNKAVYLIPPSSLPTSFQRLITKGKRRRKESDFPFPPQKLPPPFLPISKESRKRQGTGNSVRGVTVKVVYGDPEEVRALLGEHTACVERTHLTSRQMNGRLVRKSLSFSKEREMLEASCAWEDWVYNLTRPLKTLRVEVNDGRRRWRLRSPAMAAGLMDHIWTVKELLMTVVAPDVTNTK